MSTRAIVVDARIEGQGFWVKHDGYPAGLGLQLREVFSRGKPLAKIYSEIINNRVEQFNQQCHILNLPVPNVKEEYIPLGPNYIQVIQQQGVKGLWNYFGIDAAYVYTIKHDGVYVKGSGITRQRKVKVKEAVHS